MFATHISTISSLKILFRQKYSFMLRLLTKVVTKVSIVPLRGMAQKFNQGNIVWMDMEMTGLEVDKNRVIQVALLVTDANLNVISSEFNTVIHQSDQVLNDMNDWCKENLKDLAVASKNSDVTEKNAEDMMLNFISNYVEPKQSPLAGNTIYMDRMFLRKYFPRVDDYLHYRIIDVSTVKELCGRWNRKVYDGAPRKVLKHRALDDVLESINELKHYKEKFFVCL